MPDSKNNTKSDKLVLVLIVVVGLVVLGSIFSGSDESERSIEQAQRGAEGGGTSTVSASDLTPEEAEHYAELQRLGENIGTCDDVRNFVDFAGQEDLLGFVRGRITSFVRMGSDVWGGEIRADSGRSHVFLISPENIERVGSRRVLEGSIVCIAGMGFPDDGFVVVGMARD
ncbi:MAG: hypothetical protein LAT81_14740 [Oceanicaulis sp.]|nr:hypothetical protein [Oceanicaulis sp.]